MSKRVDTTTDRPRAARRWTSGARVALSGIALLAASGAAAAEAPKGVVYLGATGGQASAGLGGVILALPGSTLGSGWAIRASAAAGQYDYRQGAADIHGDFQSGQVALSRQFSGDWGYANLSAGPSYTHTWLDPADLANPRRGGKWDGSVSTDGGLKTGPVQFDWFGSYAVGGENYDASLDATAKLGRLPARAGVIALMSGDRTYRSHGVGGLLAVTPRPGIGVNLMAGSIDVGNGATGGFGTLVLSKAF